MFRAFASILVVCLFTTAVPTPAVQYSPGDWVSYTDLRYVSSVAVDLHFVYLGTTRGVAVFDRVKGTWGNPVTTGDGLPDANVKVVGLDRFADRLLCSSGANVYSMDRNNETWQVYSMTGGGTEFTSIGVDLDYIWAEGTETRIKFDKMTGSWQPVSDLPPGIEWFGERAGENIEKPEYSFLAPFYVLGENLERYPYTSAVRSETSLWLGTWGFGAYEYDLISRTGRHFIMGIAGSRTDAMVTDRGEFWFGGGSPESPGITSWQSEEDRWIYFSKEREYGLLSNRVSCMAAVDEFIWIGTEDGLIRYGRKDGSFKSFTLFDGLPANEVTAVHAAGESLWIGTSVGPCMTALSSWSPVRFDDVRTWVNDLLILEDTLWAATEDGVFVRDLSTGKWSDFKDPEELLGVSTMSILADEGKIWFGTWRGVLCLDRKSGNWERFTSPVHLPHERVRALAADTENVWVGTSSGVARFRKKTKSWEKYGLEDGLIGGEVNTIQSVGDYVYFGTDSGVTRHYWNNPFIGR